MPRTDFQILVICFHGVQDEPGKTASILLFNQFAQTHLRGLTIHSYTDSSGFPVFCAVVIVSPHYKDGMLTGIWENYCGEAGLLVPTQYERLIDFHDTAFGGLLS